MSVEKAFSRALLFAKNIALEFLKIPAFAGKEINLVKSQKLAYALVIFYPILAMVSIGLVISGTTGLDVALGAQPQSKLKIGVFFPDSVIGNEVKKELESFEYLEITSFSSLEGLKKAIETSRVRLGIELVEPEQEFSVIQTRFYYDNSNFVASSTLVGQVKTAVQSIGFKKSAQVLSTLISDLNSIEGTLDSQIGKTDELLKQLERGDAEIMALQENLKKIRLSEIQQKLGQFDIYYAEGKTGIAETLSDTDSVKEKIQKYRVTIQGLRTQVDFVKNAMDSVLLTLGQVIAELEAAQSDPGIIARLEEMRNTIGEQRKQLGSVGSELAQAEADLDDTEQKLSSAQERLVLADQRLDIAKGNIDELDSDIAQLGAILESAQEVITKTQHSKNAVKKDLLDARQLLLGLVGKLSELKSYSPEYLANPLQVSVEPIYGFSRVTSLVPFTIAFVLILTCLLLASTSMINEQNWGILYRLGASSTSFASWLAGKMLGQSVIAFIEAGLVIAVGAVLFGAPLPQRPIESIAALVVVCACFVSIGVFISNFTKVSSNAILTALLLIVPMVFLSGIIVPIEFMPPFLETTARIMPLTAAVELFQAVYLRQTDFFGLLGLFAPLIAIGLICTVYTYIYRSIKKQ
ncbi:MAG: ABC transporter permease [archaeon]|nr:ABC transporter permease [archaeon]